MMREELRSISILLAAVAASCICSLPALGSESASGGNSAAEMARKLQDPLANIAALMTDNDILFDSGDEENTSYQFQLQPVYALDFPEQGFTFIPRAVLPIIGASEGADLPPIGSPDKVRENHVWGLGDMLTQFFFAPKLEGNWKFGIGPQLSWKTHTSHELAGPEWGAGIVAVVVGGFGENFSISPLVGNIWSYNGDFSVMSIQANAYYNLPFLPGGYVAYNAPITADWKAPKGDTWTVPLGAIVGKTFDVGGGHGLDFSIGGYGNVVRPDQGPKWSLKFGIAWLLP